jgi:hypothetical protein
VVTVRLGDVLDQMAERPEPGDGVHVFRVESVFSDGKVRLRLSTSRGEELTVSIGAMKDKKTLDRNLRLLLGRTDLESVAAIRAVLEGQSIRVRLVTKDYQGQAYRFITRA